MQRLAKFNTQRLVDLLLARHTFERTGVKLYDAIIARVEASPDDNIRRMLGQLREHRNQEKAHEEWLDDQIRALGGDPHARSEMAALVARESQGIEQVILQGDLEISHLFHALLQAELSDTSGWELLVILAEEAGDRDAEEAFRERMKHEEAHLTFVRKAVARFARADVLGEPVSMPTQP